MPPAAGQARPVATGRGQIRGIEMSIADKLGGEQVIGARIANADDVARLVYQGIPTRAWDVVKASGAFTEVELNSIIPARTLRHRKERNQPLTPDESDKAVRLLRITSRAEAVFGDTGKAHRWLRRSLNALGERRPIDLATTEAGARLVETILARIEWGAAA